MTPALQMTNVTKRYGAVVALEDVSLDVRPGEILGLCGENGAGKSTLMKCLSGSIYARDFDGEIALGGEVVRFGSTLEAERAGIEMIYQEVSLHLDLSIAENIYLGRMPTRGAGLIDWPAVYRGAREALAMVGLELNPRATVRGLSTSQQQMIAIARSVIRGPKILVLDEPTSALTATEADKLFKILHNLRDRGVACIYISHKMDEVFALCDRITVLRDGRFVATHKVADVATDQVIADMVGRQLDALYVHNAPMPGRELLRLEDIDVRHPTRADRLLVEGASLTLRAGEIVGLFGLVGAGRSELMSAVFDGSYRQTGRRQGRVFVRGDEVVIRSPADAINHQIAMLTEDRKVSGFVGTMNITRNITLAALNRVARGGVIDGGAERSLAHDLATRLSLKAAGLRASVLSLSGGNQQKVVLSKWLASEPQILILDEPTRGIDVGAKAEIYRLMSELANKGLGIILISSEMPELLAMSDRVVVLGEGRVQGTFDRAEITQDKLLQAASGQPGVAA
ncbi:hypothetical protein ACMU_12190 [Actibacterium mucosum KCTC 23349]|uniref:ABC transporter domain-containing protein n=1 Tax=Actibacterium mucosum KCTC 23349 TaxID=1454373 RepID=A0A037ZG86_9RHOB|nr:sugar ABC transporter ATP-binding protein [Actibacterium mucosum]KAJ55450.1 hypothetical protein ACMU_12190 [Actibacterium mucosum KCTC 23349]